MKTMLRIILAVVVIHLLWDVYQDIPSVTGFTDHTVECAPLQHRSDMLKPDARVVT